MALAMDGPQEISEDMLEQEEAVYPCKGCGEILEEGKAFELAGNRWHIDCFRCNSCRTLLGSDANLLLLGDGSLICNNCTYSCTVCGDKIEDLAILTGEQAFCAKCFKCRNCKQKIENLKYAKTSQGIFCMNCHESLMARRKKKSRSTPRVDSSQSGQITPGLDKGLPAIPRHPPPQGIYSPEDEQMQENSQRLHKDSVSSAYDVTSPMSAMSESKDNMLLNSRSYGDNKDRKSANGEDEFSIPLTFDPSPAIPSSRKNDYFAGAGLSTGNFRAELGDLFGTSRSGSRERNPSKNRGSPHIAYQDKGRVPSSDTVDSIRRRLDSGRSTPVSAEASERLRMTSVDDDSSDRFRLQDAPKRRTSGGVPDPPASPAAGHIAGQRKASPSYDGTSDIAANIGLERSKGNDANSLQKNRPSLKKSPLSSPVAVVNRDRKTSDTPNPKPAAYVPRKEVPRPGEQELHNGANGDRQTALGKQEPIFGKPLAKLQSASSSTYEALPARSPRRPFATQAPHLQEDGDESIASRVAPTVPPPPSADSRHKTQPSVTSIQSENFHTSPSLALVGSGDSNYDDDGSRAGDDDSNLFRKMSKVVRHGRSHSDKLGSSSPKWGPSKGSRNVSVDISSPFPSAKGDDVDLRNRLRYSQQRIAELEAEKLVLLEQVNGTDDIQQVNSELRQKRSTMAVLDTQRELVVRELEVMTNQLHKVKSTNGPLDLDALRSEVVRDFATSMEKLKLQLVGQIEELMTRKNDLTSEISTLIQMKDKGFQEYESLSSKNHQLNEHNKQLVQNIQGMYQQAKQPGAAPSNGLGIYAHSRDNASFDAKTQDTQLSQLSGDTEIDQASVLTGSPQVVNIRSAKGQPKKFSWKKSRETAKNVGKGFKGAFASTQGQALREEGGFAESVPYNSIPANETLPTTGTTPLAPSKGGSEPKQAWHFLNPDKKGAAGGPPLSKSPAASTGPSLPPNTPSPETSLFGSDLTARCEFEKSVIPNIVMSCIDQVSLRGVDQEGVYRKSGSSTQVRAIQAGFERDFAGHDISDPELDIHAVTGCMKQYFRRLPNPLITFEAYDAFLDAVRDDAAEATKVARLADVVRNLPKCHRETLEFLCFHLVAVMERSAQNLMTSLNLAVVFAPTIMRPETIEREMTDTHIQRQAVQVMLENFGGVFEQDESL